MHFAAHLAVVSFRRQPDDDRHAADTSTHHFVTFLSAGSLQHASNKNYKAFVKALLRVLTDAHFLSKHPMHFCIRLLVIDHACCCSCCCCCCVSYPTRSSHRFITPHAANKNYKAFVKALLRVSTDALNSDDAKEIENLAGTIRADKVKAEKAAAAAKKGCECPVFSCFCLV
jgi:hypothetical protein